MLYRTKSIRDDIIRIQTYPFYYGWVILAVATLGTICTGPGQTYCVSLFLEYFIDELSLSRSTVSSLYTAGTLLGSFALPFVGRQFDRLGARFMITCIAFLFGIACIFMGLVHNALMLGIGFFLIRMLGQGSLSLSCTNVINQWWVQRRGPLLGLSGTIVALFGLGLTPNIIHWLIPILGWRYTYIALGCILIVFLAPISLYFVRNRLEDFDILPDARGREYSIRPSKRLQGILALLKRPEVETPEVHWTVDEAIRTPIFWVFNVSKAAIALISTGLLFHIVSIFADNNLPVSFAAAAYLPIALAAACTNLIGGLLVEVIRLRTILAYSLVCMAIALTMAPYLNSALQVSFFGICLGASIGLSQTVHTVAWAKYYGRLHLGSISGLVSTCVVAASAIGPLPMGIAHDVLGSYDSTLLIFAVIPVILAISCLFVDTPKK